MKSKKVQGKLDRLFSKSKTDEAEEKKPKAPKKKKPKAAPESVKPQPPPEKIDSTPETKEKVAKITPPEKSKGTIKSEEVLKELQKSKKEGEESKEGENVLELLTFSLTEEWYALEIQYVEGIIHLQKITEVPGIPDYILGVTNVRGEIVSVVDVRRFLNLEASTAPAEPSIIILKYSEVTTGFFVDSVGDVAKISTNSIDPPLATIEKIQAEFILGEAKLSDNFLAILNMKNLMNSDRMKV